ncbi:MAG: cytochrome c biogenesis protein CcsA [Bacteroidetes bacterium]|nr:cytochrome c biogenesis protein CcsA [Bacteroidota bacterium]
MNIQYIDEHLMPGILGNTFVWISLIALLLAMAFYLQTLRKNSALAMAGKLADTFFILHFVTLIGAIGSLYYLIFHHYFEYAYVWQYSATDLPTRFLVSCFWAGQEGSFLTWALMQGILGLILIKTTKEWKSWVMPVFITGQLFLMTMVLGVSVFGYMIGGSPFTLLRDMPMNQGVDLFREPNYLSMIVEGNGLNPLLENIWMIIHPPSLFLGYAVSLVPFSFAIASLWRKQYHSWLKPALPWTIASIFTLGFGILLGGRWAYESLTFGGFWAWDPVENASLVPWLFLVASLHLMLIASKRYHSYATMYLFSFLGWIFVVYATYLTRSGVLGETSVHAFGDSGKSLQMLVFNGIYLVFPLLLLVFRKKEFPKKDSDEVFSREFWMLIGSIIVVLSAFQVTLTTSIPVINKVLGTTIAPPVDNVHFYNTWQLPFALLVALLIGLSQYMHYGKNEFGQFLKKISLTAGISVLLTAILALGDHIIRFDYIFLLFVVVFAAVVSIDYIIRFSRKTSNYGSSISHAGFVIFIMGVILAFSNSQIISRNTSGMDLGKEKDNQENLVLTKGISLPMGEYNVTYTSSEDKGRETFFKVDFSHKDDPDSKVAFSLYPSVNHNSRMGNVYNPDTKHFLDKDIYTFISFAQQTTGATDSTGYTRSFVQQMNLHDTVIFSHSFVILDSIHANMKDKTADNAEITAFLRILSMNSGLHHAVISYKIINGVLQREDSYISPLEIKLRFEGISPDSKDILVGMYEKKQDFIVIKAMLFPYMNVMWIGAIIMFTGFTYSISRRIRNRKGKVSTLQSSEEEASQA